MKTVYGRCPKRITCQCYGEDVNEDMVIIQLNDRCHVCNQLLEIRIPKREVKIQMPLVESHGMQVA